MSKVGDKLKSIRVQKGLTQEKVAQLYGCNVTQINGWERGRSVPNAASRMQLARALGLPPDYFLDSSGASTGVPQTAAIDELFATVAQSLGLPARRLRLSIEIMP